MNREKLLEGEFHNDILTNKEMLNVFEHCKLQKKLKVKEIEEELERARLYKRLQTKLELNGYKYL